MSGFATKLMRLPRPPLAVVALTASMLVGPQPAQAQDVFGFFRPFLAPAPAYQPYDFAPPPRLEHFVPRFRTRPKPISVDKPAGPAPAAIKMPEKPKAPGETTNPVPELLSDSTLQAGDMVMFPDGLRVFTGRPGGHHKLADFEPVARVGKALPSSTRKLAATLRPGANIAWSADVAKGGGKLTGKAKDVDTTGSVKQKVP